MIVNTDDLMGLRDIAKAAAVTDAAVANWKKRYPTFPKPIVTISDGTPIWLRPIVKEWLQSNNKVYDHLER